MKMAQIKKLNVSFFVMLQKDLTTTSELIRARQDEKQALLDEFIQETKRYFFGKISQKALVSSVVKTNKELKRLDNSIRDAISKAKRLSDRERVSISNQSPVVFKATLSGVVGGNKKAGKKKSKKKAKKKK